MIPGAQTGHAHHARFPSCELSAKVALFPALCQSQSEFSRYHFSCPPPAHPTVSCNYSDLAAVPSSALTDQPSAKGNLTGTPEAHLHQRPFCIGIVPHQ